MITLSIVSHGTPHLVNSLLRSFSEFYIFPLQIIITENKNTNVDFELPECIHNIKILINETPKGFGANHNAAFKYCDHGIFVVMNPDIKFIDIDFALNEIHNLHIHNRNVDFLAVPKILNPDSTEAEIIRKDLTVASLVKRKIYKKTAIVDNEKIWFPGMFHIYNSNTFLKTMFDERFFMYCEDADISRQVRNIGGKLEIIDSIEIIHVGQRDSQRKLRYFFWHSMSVIKYLVKYSFK